MKQLIVLAIIATSAFAGPVFQIRRPVPLASVVPGLSTPVARAVPEVPVAPQILEVTPVVQEVPVVPAVPVVPVTKSVKSNEIPYEHERRQNEAARYKFSSDIDDHISDSTHQRSEEREGLAVKGMYSYSDGYYKRTVQYVADKNGYRVVNMEAIPLDVEGPRIDLGGTASVQSQAHGTHVAYKVQSVPIEGPVGKVVGEAREAILAAQDFE